MNALSEMEVDYDRLQTEAKRTEEYNGASPFPHIAIDDFVSPDVMEAVHDELVSDTNRPWYHMDDRYQLKYACADMRMMGPRTRALIHFLNGQEVTNFLQELTGIEGLVPDPTLAGGGLHELRDGGYLNIHADFNFHRRLRLDRRVNLLLYFNKDWKEEYGGNLELWDTEMKECVKRYTPDFNRCIIFNTTDKAYHGNPQPITTPDGRTRRSIALYYYSNGRPKDEVTEDHMTLFQYRPGEASVNDRGRRLMKRLLPPIISDFLGRGKVR